MRRGNVVDGAVPVVLGGGEVQMALALPTEGEAWRCSDRSPEKGAADAVEEVALTSSKLYWLYRHVYTASAFNLKPRAVSHTQCFRLTSTNLPGLRSYCVSLTLGSHTSTYMLPAHEQGPARARRARRTIASEQYGPISEDREHIQVVSYLSVNILPPHPMFTLMTIALRENYPVLAA